ncbi:hypothetical protein ABW19_dt0202436 [Dactylella cylindrospora]|nr:hypothetical protein ABW19_dt0202436 [Dactylella cylindrospora]
MLLSNLVAALPVAALPTESAPSSRGRLSRLARRDATEVIYLTAAVAPSTPPYYLSYVAYYPTTTLGYAGDEPDPNDEALGPWGGLSLWNTWPTPCSGNTHYEISFPSGVLFQFDLNFGAASAAVGATIGGGWNGYHGFTCVKDSGRVLYELSDDGDADVLALVNCTRAA